MDIRISRSRTLRGTTLATVRVLTSEDVQWYRVTLPADAVLAQVQRDIIAQTLAHLERHGGPAARLVSFQLALPCGGER
jgi:hypothetical protein